MYYNLFDAQGIAIIVLFIIVVALFLLNLSLRKKFKEIFRSKDDTSLDNILAGQIKKTDKLEREAVNLINELLGLKEESKRMVQKVNIKRYNPFKETGSDQSFTISLLDGRNNGLLITGLHLRDGMRVYAKPVQAGSSEYKLSEEESEILKNDKQ